MISPHSVRRYGNDSVFEFFHRAHSADSIPGGSLSRRVRSVGSG